MAAALGWGALAASSLVLGVFLAFARGWPARMIGLILAFGAGALISAVSFELAEEGIHVGSPRAVGVGLAVGALTYYLGDDLIARRTRTSPAGRSRRGWPKLKSCKRSKLRAPFFSTRKTREGWGISTGH